MTVRDAVEIIFRIPGTWSDLGEFVARLGDGYRFETDRLTSPSGDVVEIYFRPPDEQFPRIFRTSCRQAPTAEELLSIHEYTVNVCLCGPGGSRDAVGTMMSAGAAVIRAGGAGVFIDNSGLAHGAQQWLKMCQDGGPDAMSYAFVNIISGRRGIRTLGLHVFGLPDLLLPVVHPRSSDSDVIVEMLRYMCAADYPLADGHILADEHGPSYRAEQTSEGEEELPTEHPMHNPFGRLKLVSMRVDPESN